MRRAALLPCKQSRLVIIIQSDKLIRGSDNERNLFDGWNHKDVFEDRHLFDGWNHKEASRREGILCSSVKG